MVTVNSNDELLKKCSYVAISSYRRKVLETLKNDVKIPTKISEESGVGIKHVSNVLTDLKEHNLIAVSYTHLDVYKRQLIMML